MKEEDRLDMEKSKKPKKPRRIKPDTKEYVMRLLPPEVEVESQEKKEFLEEFVAIVDKNLSDSDFCIDTIYKEQLVSRATLFRKVKELTGKTPNDFIQAYRLERAAQLLRDDYGNVTEVSYAVGFSDPYYFSKRFKEKFGQSPKPYQLAHLKTSEGELPGEQEEAESGGNKTQPLKPLNDFTIGELDGELIARSAQMLMKRKSAFNKLDGTTQLDELFKQFIEYYKLNLKLYETLDHYSTDEIIHQLQQMIDARKKAVSRDGIYSDKRLELFDITNNRVRMNTHAVAAVCMSSDLFLVGSNNFKLKIKTYGPAFGLHKKELFFNQPIGAGSMCTGVLVGKDMIATVAHFANEKNVTDLRFIFDFVMLNPITPVEQIPLDNIYKGVEILGRVHNPEGDWALIKLDRNVANREIAVLSHRDIFPKQPMYVIGHPCGLPLKYAPGARVGKSTGNYFWADLDVYSSSSGSPVFCAETHELIGIVSRGRTADFRLTEEGWITMRYPKTKPIYKGSQCTRVSEFSKYVVK